MKNKPDLFNTITPRALERLQKRLNSFNSPHPNALGVHTIFGVMPDWNPAEMIGLKPKRLALSLYKEIITDSVWAYQRDNYGYRALRSHPLMHSFLGVPYIDVRVSFNSFIPKSLDENIAKKLADYYLNELENSPQAHDKIEFDIVFSCYDLATPKKLKKLLDFGFNENEIKRIEFSLLVLTNGILDAENGLYLKDIKKSQKLDDIFEEIVNSNLSIYDKIYWLIENCKRYGTLPFAGVARAAFVAVQILNSLVECGILTQEQKAQFLASLNTISKQLSTKIKNLDSQNKSEFLAQFGHLRAGSYDILSPRYDEAFEQYFGNALDKKNAQQENKSKQNKAQFVLDSQTIEKINTALAQNGLKISADELFKFFKIVIEGREELKFKFSKLLSKTIEYIKELGQNLGICASDMAHLDIKNILSLYSSLYAHSPKERFLEQIKANKKEYELTMALKLPSLIVSSQSVYEFFSPKVSPNFITQKSVVAEVVLVQDGSENLKGKIALIAAADPGFDYLFTKEILGFITCWGGANSHMAIRASELAMPAVIGVGEENFAMYKNAKRISLNCANQQIICL